MSNKRPLVSVVIPLYNYEKYIGYTIQSILNQSYKKFEIIVVDDCSTDSSLKIAKKYEQKYNMIRVLSLNKNSGYSKAKNEGIIVSSGDLITCLDADDMFTVKSLAKRVGLFEQFSTVDMVHGRAIEVYGDVSLDEAYNTDLSKAKRTRVKIHAQGVMLRRSVHIKYGLYDEKLRSRSDKEMWWRLLGINSQDQKINCIGISADVAYYRKHDLSMMSMRKINKKYNKKVTKLLYEAHEDRVTNGINSNNTRFLKK